MMNLEKMKELGRFHPDVKACFACGVSNKNDNTDEIMPRVWMCDHCLEAWLTLQASQIRKARGMSPL